MAEDDDASSKSAARLQAQPPVDPNPDQKLQPAKDDRPAQ
jgi:sec-independent protein translocase protein TatA